MPNREVKKVFIIWVVEDVRKSREIFLMNLFPSAVKLGKSAKRTNTSLQQLEASFKQQWKAVTLKLALWFDNIKYWLKSIFLMHLLDELFVIWGYDRGFLKEGVKTYNGTNAVS